MGLFQDFGTAVIVWTSLTVGLYAQGDDCSSATPIVGLGSFQYDNSMATSSWQGCRGEKDLFWLWSPPAPGNYKIELSPNFDSTLGVFEFSNCSFSNQVGCNMMFFAVGGVSIFGADPSIQYLIQVSADQNPGGPGILEILDSPCTPSNHVDDVFEENDDFSSASAIGAGSYPNLFVAHDDPDFYAITIPPGQGLEVNAAVAGSGPFYLAIHHQSGGVVVGGITNVEYYPESAAPTEVYLEVSKPFSQNDSLNCNLYDLTVRFELGDPNLVSFCNPATLNSFGRSTRLHALPGTLYGVDWILLGFNGPPGQFGYFLVADQYSDPGVSLGAGALCLTGLMGYYNEGGTLLDSVGVFSSNGSLLNLVGTGFLGHGFVPQPDLPQSLGMIQPGQTWHFQIWHREPGGGSNLSNGMSIAF